MFEAAKRVKKLRMSCETVQLPDDWLCQFAIELLEQLDGTWAEIEVAFKREDIDTLAAEIHRIKGTAGVVGLNRLSELAAECELVLHASSLADVHNVLGRMRRYVTSGLELAATLHNSRS